MGKLINYFGDKIYSPAEILKDKKLLKVIEPIFIKLCKELSIPSENSVEIFNRLLELSLTHPTNDIEYIIHCEFERLAVAENWTKAFGNRAIIIYNQINKYIKGDIISDIGCGDGGVSQLLFKRFKSIKLFDVQDYVLPNINLPFHKLTEGEKLPKEVECDTSLLLTVLHHSEKPIELLKELYGLTNSRCIIIESVVGISFENLPINSPLKELNSREQFRYASYWDWFYNRVIHKDVNVPYNYLSPSIWIDKFEEIGWKVTQSIELGIDQPLVPEFHYLFILDK